MLTSPAVLVPGFDLCVAEVQFRSELHAVLDTEVFLSLEALLERVQLVISECCPCLTRLLRLVTSCATASTVGPTMMLQRLA